MEKETKTGSRMIRTSHFGEIQVEEEHIFLFNEGLLGFDDLHEYVLISEEESEPFKWLVSLEQPEIGFPLISPWLIDAAYSPGKNFNPEFDVFFVVVTFGGKDSVVTANLKAPVVFDVKKLEGRQIILQTDKYSPTHIISDNSSK